MATKNCKQCDKTFASASSLSRHKRSHDQSNKVTCELCGKQFRKDNLKRHKCKNVMIDSEKKIFRCDICRMEFDKEANLKQHSDVHTEKLSCNLCEKKIRPRSMKRHIELVHTITQFDDNFMRVLSKNRDITTTNNEMEIFIKSEAHESSYNEEALLNSGEYIFVKEEHLKEEDDIKMEELESFIGDVIIKQEEVDIKSEKQVEVDIKSEIIGNKFSKNSDLNREVECNFCSKMISPNALKQHIEKNHAIIVKSKKCDPYCRFCHMKFARKSNYNRHMRRQHKSFFDQTMNRHVINGNIFTVDGKKINLEDEDTKDVVNFVMDFILHKVVKSIKTFFKCDLCNSIEFDAMWKLRNHKKKVHVKQNCNECGKEIKGGTYNMNKHISRFHMENRSKKKRKEKPYVDRVTKLPKESYSRGHLYKKAKELQENLRKEENYCNESDLEESKIKLTEIYENIIKLKDNVDKTKGMDPNDPIHEKILYPCNKCDYKAKKKYQLKAHTVSIHKSMPYSCDQCDYKAKNYNQLELHIGSVHEHSVSCNLCDKKYTHQTALRHHKASEHEGVRYPCAQCDYKAKDKSSLKKHVKSIHDKVFAPCDMCDKVYTHPDNLIKHRLSVHEGIFYMCDQCDYKGTQKRYLNSHIEKYHKI